MKNLLLASTALLLSAGIAAADVRVGGDGRMGVTFTEGATEEFAFTSRIRISFAASGETDGGLSFGGSIRADNASNGDDGDADVSGGVGGAAGNVFISGAFGRLSMGDVSGAAEFIVGDLHGVGLTGLGDFNEMTYLSNAGANRPSARYDYSMGDFRFALSADNPGSGSETFSIAAGYTMAGFGIGFGYEDTGAADHWIIGVNGSFGDVSMRAIYGESGAADQYGVSASGSFSGVGVTAFYRSDFAAAEHYGLGMSYGLGGGASIVGGIVSTAGTTRADFGVSFRF